MVMTENALIRKLSLISTGKLIIKIRILANVFGSKGNQTMKFGQLIEYNIIIFLINSSTECG